LHVAQLSRAPPKHGYIAVGISLIAALEPEISWWVILPPSVTKNGCKNRYRMLINGMT